MLLLRSFLRVFAPSLFTCNCGLKGEVNSTTCVLGPLYDPLAHSR